MAAISVSSRRLRNVSVSLGLSVISPVTSLRAIHISLTSTRNALGKRMAWLWPLVKTLAVASMVPSLKCIYENVPTLSPSN